MAQSQPETSFSLGQCGPRPFQWNALY
ncbi:MAG: hypothetical protein RL635_66, partial [Chloroflexota bacterium]